MEKTRISAEKARTLLIDFNDLKLLDRIYGAVRDFFGEEIYNIQTEHEIIGEDGTPYTDFDSVQWYDEIEEDFICKCYGIIKDDINS